MLKSSCSRLIQQMQSSSTNPIIAFVKDLEKRTLIADSHPAALPNSHLGSLQKIPPSLYAGFDPSASSLHLGNLVIILSLFRASRFNCQPIALVGGATALIGDPSGRVSGRQVIRLEEATQNRRSLLHQLQNLWKNARDSYLKSSSKEVVFLDNMQWYADVTLLDFLSQTRSLRLGEMLRTRAIRARLEAPAEKAGIAFPEFVYQSLQAYDWKLLAEQHECFFQIGGADQLGHLDIGAHFIGRTMGKFAAGVCLPLITDAAGNKVGKSTGNATWLDKKKTTPFNFYQSLRQMKDEEAANLFLRCSLRESHEVEEVLEEHSKSLGAWVAQKELARELTRIVHGEVATRRAEACSEALFYGSIADVEKLDMELLEEALGEAKELRVRDVESYGELAEKTNEDAKNVAHLMKAGAFKVNGEAKKDGSEMIGCKRITLSNAPVTLISWGKRNFQLVKWTDSPKTS